MCARPSTLAFSTRRGHESARAADTLLLRASHNAAMSSHTRPILSVGDVLGLVALLPLVIGKMLTFIAVSSWLQLKEGSLSVRALRRNAVASLGTAIGVLSPRQVRTLLVRTTGETITKYCVARTLSHQSELVVNDDGYSPATLHFVDCKLDGKGPILLYFQYVVSRLSDNSEHSLISL